MKQNLDMKTTQLDSVKARMAELEDHVKTNVRHFTSIVICLGRFN